MPVRVLIVDDLEPFRKAAHEVVAASDGFVAVGEAVSGEEALGPIARVHPGPRGRGRRRAARGAAGAPREVFRPPRGGGGGPAPAGASPGPAAGRSSGSRRPAPGRAPRLAAAPSNPACLIPPPALRATSPAR